MFTRATLRRFLPRRSTSGDRSIRQEVSELRRCALAYEADGRIRDAIAVWTKLNRLQSEAQIEEHLVDLRCDGRVRKPNVTPAESWPRQIDDPFPDVFARPPEVDADELSSELLGGAILHHGCLLVRGLVARDRVDTLRATVDRAFAGRGERLQGAPSDETTPWYMDCARWDAFTPGRARTSRQFNDGCNAVHVADSPRALFQAVEALQGTNVVDVISEYLGERAVLSGNKTLLRRVPPDAKPSWHQDGSFMGLRTRVVNLWVALSDCGDGNDAPGIAILPRRLDVSVRGEVSDGKIVFTADEFETASDGIGAVRPTFERGDALLFDELLAHANGGGQPGLTRNRYALEAWMFAPSSMPTHYLPILV